jgi:hypothetical protein
MILYNKEIFSVGQSINMTTGKYLIKMGIFNQQKLIMEEYKDKKIWRTLLGRCKKIMVH